MNSTRAHTPSIVRTTVVSIWILFILSYLAIQFNIYYTFAWFDTFMHFFGGLVSALVIYSGLMRFGIPVQQRTTLLLLLIVVGVIVVGAAWEVLEYVVNYYIPTYTFDPVDTTVDMIADTVGALVAVIFIRNHRKKYIHGN